MIIKDRSLSIIRWLSNVLAVFDNCELYGKGEIVFDTRFIFTKLSWFVKYLIS